MILVDFGFHLVPVTCVFTLSRQRVTDRWCRRRRRRWRCRNFWIRPTYQILCCMARSIHHIIELFICRYDVLLLRTIEILPNSGKRRKDFADFIRVTWHSQSLGSKLQDALQLILRSVRVYIKQPNGFLGIKSIVGIDTSQVNQLLCPRWPIVTFRFRNLFRFPRGFFHRRTEIVHLLDDITSCFRVESR